jgi:hypothetical protein
LEPKQVLDWVYTLGNAAGPEALVVAWFNRPLRPELEHHPADHEGWMVFGKETVIC